MSWPNCCTATAPWSIMRRRNASITPAITRNDDHTRPWKITKASADSTGKSCTAIPNTNVRYVCRSPGTVSKWIQPQTSGNVIAAASTHPHMISQ